MSESSVWAEATFSGQKLILRQASQPTSLGFPYFELVLESDHRTGVYRIWANELIWFLMALSKIRDQVRWSECPTGSHALLFEPTPSGAQSIFLSATDGNPYLLFRRYQNSTQSKSDTQSYYTRYFVFQMTNQLKIPLIESSLSEFCIKGLRALHQSAEKILFAMGSSASVDKEIPFGIYNRLAHVSGTTKTLRRVLIQPGQSLEKGGSHWILPEDAQEIVLKAATGVGSFAEVVATIGNVLDERSVKSHLEWPRRYAQEVLGQGFVLNQQDATSVSAARSVESFASDPLLSSLGKKPPMTRPGNGKVAAVPQCSEKALHAVLSRGNCDGVATTRLGEVPVPTATKRAEIQALLAPATGLRVHRWKILQCLELWSAAACNLADKNPVHSMFEIQRLQLLEGDVRSLFADDQEIVEPVLQRSMQRRESILAGSQTFEAYQSLPKR